MARDKHGVEQKKRELISMEIPFKIICGEDLKESDIIYRAPKGKYDAINFGVKFVPLDTDVILFNDVDTEIKNLKSAIQKFNDDNVGIVFSKIEVGTGPQKSFYKLEDFIRRRIVIASNGELFMIRKRLLDSILPLKPCKAEDSYIMFRVMEMGKKVVFTEETYAKTRRTKIPEDEEKYKRRTVGGLYQALSISKPPITIKIFYMLLPIVSPLLIVLGKKGYYSMKGILLGYLDYLRGDVSGHWEQTY